MITKKELIALADKYEVEEFVETDPIRFPLSYSYSLLNTEVAAVISQWLSYGKRDQFMPCIEYLIEEVMDNSPYQYIFEGDWHKYENDYTTIYRFNTWHNFYHLMAKLKAVYIKYETLEDAVIDSMKVNKCKYYHQALCHLLFGENMIPRPNSQSPCKKLNMMLRWLVRQDSSVDIGIWNNLSPNKLLIPLDTHVLHQANEMEIIRSKRESLNNAIAITNYGKKIFPNDPTRLDFALYGKGING